MSFLDVLFGIPILWAAYKGFSRGFIHELTSLVGLILAIVGTIYFSDITASFLQNTLKFHTKYMFIIAFATTFVVILVVIHTIGKFLRNIIHTLLLGWLDKILGLVFGLASVILILAILVNAFEYVNEKIHILSVDSKENSILYKPLNEIALAFYDWFDFDFSEWGKKINEQMNKIKEKVS